jgi:hypothetical protein
MLQNPCEASGVRPPPQRQLIPLQTRSNSWISALQVMGVQHLPDIIYIVGPSKTPH